MGYAIRFNATDRLWSVEFWDADTGWRGMAEFEEYQAAAEHVHYLNGGMPVERVEALIRTLLRLESHIVRALDNGPKVPVQVQDDD